MTINYDLMRRQQNGLFPFDKNLISILKYFRHFSAKFSCLTYPPSKKFHSHGFRSGHNTAQTVGQLNNWVLEAMDGGKLTGLLFVNISKAFDSINHKVLLGMSGKTLGWFKSYLADRRQSVNINGELSETHPITLGVPQGGILGPLCYSTFILRTLLCKNQTKWEMKIFDPHSNLACK